MIIVVILAVIGFIIYSSMAAEKRRVAAEKLRVADMTPDQLAEHQRKLADDRSQLADSQRLKSEARQRKAAVFLYGPVNSVMFCPHCQVRGHIHTKEITQKKGVSGGKATGALLTGGLSLFATGLSRKEANTQAHCGHCSNSWMI